MRYGRAGRAAVEGRSWPVVIDELIGHYEGVLAGTGAGSSAGTGAGSSADPARLAPVAG